MFFGGNRSRREVFLTVVSTIFWDVPPALNDDEGFVDHGCAASFFAAVFIHAFVSLCFISNNSQKTFLNLFYKN